MLKLPLIAVALVMASTSSHADNCDEIRSRIEARIRASGVVRFTLTAVETGARINGKVVGTCDLGKKKIVYARSEPSGSANGDQAVPGATGSTSPSSEAPILTECRDGSASLGGDCRK
jgi:hypothetical protein